LGPIPNPQSPIPNPQSPYKIVNFFDNSTSLFKIFYILKFLLLR
jgi:hypothetical protein